MAIAMKALVKYIRKVAHRVLLLYLFQPLFQYNHFLIAICRSIINQVLIDLQVVELQVIHQIRQISYLNCINFQKIEE